MNTETSEKPDGVNMSSRTLGQRQILDLHCLQPEGLFTSRGLIYMSLVTSQASKKKQARPHRSEAKRSHCHSMDPFLSVPEQSVLESCAGPSQTAVTRSSGLPTAPVHICIQMHGKSWIQGPNLLTQSTQWPVLSLKPPVHHMASGQAYNPCDLLSCKKTDPTLYLHLGRENSHLGLFPSWEKHMNPN